MALIELVDAAGLVSNGGVVTSNCAILGMSVDNDFADKVLGQESDWIVYSSRSEPSVAKSSWITEIT